MADSRTSVVKVIYGFARRNLLTASVFITGACVLVVEVVAVRVLSPYFGNTIFTVSSVISVILAALSIGYYAGGKLADKHPSMRWFFSIIMLSGVVLAAFYWLGKLILPPLGENLSLASGPLVTSLLLFLVPALLLGTLSPYAVTLQSRQLPEAGVGTVSGRIFFWSTLGSISGSLAAGFVLVPQFGIDTIFIGCTVVLFLLGAVPLVLLKMSKILLVLPLLLLLCLGAATATQAARAGANTLYTKDGVYEKISIYDSSYDGRPARFFQQDKSASGAMFLDTDDPTDLVFGYTKYYALYKLFRPEVSDALVIGGGAYSIPKALLAESSQTRVDVAEIEPSLFGLAKKYFKVTDNPRLTDHVIDGRQLLKKSDKHYDLIFSDVYYSLFSIPSHFTTREFFSLARERLSDEGVFAANLIGDLSRQKPSFLMSEIKTFQEVFPNSYVFAVDDPSSLDTQNIVIIGRKDGKKPDFAALAQRDRTGALADMESKQVDMPRFDLSDYPVLTDNYAPADYLTSKTLSRSSQPEAAKDTAEMMALLRQTVGYGPRYSGSKGHADTQEFIEAEMRAQGAQVVTQDWKYRSDNGKTYGMRNIITRFNPEKADRVILATHYDSKRTADRDGDPALRNQPVPGANDAASAVAVLLAAGRYLGEKPPGERPGVDIVFFDGEEGDVTITDDFSRWQPLGSSYFAEHVSDIYGTTKPAQAAVFDLVCKKDLRLRKEPSSVSSAGSQLDSFWTIGRAAAGDTFQETKSKLVKDDHTPLQAAGIPSFLVADVEYPWLHTTQDTVDKCSADSLSAVSRSVQAFIDTLR